MYFYFFWLNPSRAIVLRLWSSIRIAKFDCWSRAVMRAGLTALHTKAFTMLSPSSSLGVEMMLASRCSACATAPLPWGSIGASGTSGRNEAPTRAVVKRSLT